MATNDQWTHVQESWTIESFACTNWVTIKVTIKIVTIAKISIYSYTATRDRTGDGPFQGDW